MSRRWSKAAVALLILPALASAQRGGFGGGGATPGNSAVFAPSAPTFPTNDPIIKRIWALGMDSSHTEQLGQVLFDSLGPRLMGGPELKHAQDWLVKTYRSWGIDAREERYGTWRGWVRGPSHIDLIAPRVRTLEGTMVGYSPGTGGKNVVYEPIILPHFADSAEFVKWLPHARGKLVLVNAPPASCRPTDDWAANAAPEVAARMDTVRQELAREWGGRNVRGTGYSLALGGGELGVRLEKGGAGGIITSRPKNGWGTREIFETYNTRTPAISLSCEDYGLVFRLAEHHQHPKLRLNLDGKLLGEQPVFNVVAMVKGSEHPDEYVVLSSHFDSWDGSSGATDNGTGTLTMLEAMRILRQVLPHPKRTIIAGHWSGEEEGEVGSKAFTEDHPEVMKGLQALFNQDNGTGRIVRINAGGLPDAAEHLTRWMNTVPVEFKTQTGYDGSPGRPAGGGSDDFSFSCAGAPIFGLGALGWDYGNYTWHTDRDTYDKVVFPDLHANATLTAMLVYLASEDSTQITRQRVDLVALARQDSINAAARGGGQGFGRGFGRGRGGPPAWPSCEKAPRSTNPRLK
ncbi:MAG: M20/M25/M40 family metallo-hydrolase [Gemmatimonadaceae bacterium]